MGLNVYCVDELWAEIMVKMCDFVGILLIGGAVGIEPSSRPEPPEVEQEKKTGKGKVRRWKNRYICMCRKKQAGQYRHNV
uniref:Uncharacterized protein n=1 Tax=Salix viminalis TaxID=40686 RepID=A0A6N2LVS1_SALVM